MGDLVNFTVRDAYESLAKNGFHHLRSNWITTTKNEVVSGGCAMGQMAANLGVLPFSAYKGIGDYAHALDNQLNRFRVSGETCMKYLPDRGYSIADSRGLADFLVSINDYSVVTRLSNGAYRRKYTYKWAQIAEIAYEVMEPFFDKVITLRTWEFKLPENMETVNAS